MTQILWQSRDITGLVVSATVEQTLSAAGREAILTAVYAPGDSRFSLLNPACGDGVVIYQEGTVLFRGKVERVSWSSDSLAVTLICYDVSSLLAKNEFYRAFSGTPSQIAATLCTLCGLPIGSLWAKSGRFWIAPSCGRTAFSVLQEVYGNQCVTESQNGAVMIRQQGAALYTLRTEAPFSISAAHSCEALVTGASVISGAGKVKAAVYQAGLEAQYGRRRQVFSLNGSQRGAAEQARARLNSLSRTGQITIPGDTGVRCGARIQPDKGSFGLAGSYLIASVLHSIRAGSFTTTIGMVQA